MPYIEQTRRDAISNGAQPDNAGELNFRLTMILLAADNPERNDVLKACEQYISHKGLRYQFINDVLGACDGAAREIARRTHGHEHKQRLLRYVAAAIYDAIAGPYEDQKRIENGDIPYV